MNDRETMRKIIELLESEGMNLQDGYEIILNYIETEMM